MWAKEYSAETVAQPEQIWQLCTDVAGWPAWNGDIERIELIGPFAAGSTILMTRLVRSRPSFVAQRLEGELFVDEADLGEIVVRTTHRVHEIDSARARVTGSPWGRAGTSLRTLRANLTQLLRGLRRFRPERVGRIGER